MLSGSTDGLVNIYDTTVAEEDDALVQVINHGSVHHAGYLSDKTIYALSHDEVFSIHPATSPDDQSEALDPKPAHFGDLRPVLSCEYVAQLFLGSQGAHLAIGNKEYVIETVALGHTVFFFKKKSNSILSVKRTTA